MEASKRARELAACSCVLDQQITCSVTFHQKKLGILRPTYGLLGCSICDLQWREKKDATRALTPAI